MADKMEEREKINQINNNSTNWLALLLKMSSLNQALQVSKCKQLSALIICSRFLSSDDFNRQRGVAMSITVTISAIQSHMPDINADEMSNSRRSPSLILSSVATTTLAYEAPRTSS